MGVAVFVGAGGPVMPFLPPDPPVIPEPTPREIARKVRGFRRRPKRVLGGLRVTVTLPEDVVVWLGDRARGGGVSVGAVVRGLVEAAMGKGDVP